MRTTSRVVQSIATSVLVGAILVLPPPAFAVTATLRPNADIALRETNLGEEGSLGGSVIEDALVAFTVRDAGGRSCRGRLQVRVVRSTATGELDFYYRIRDTSGSGTLAGITARDFSHRSLRVGYRSDSVGSVAPTRAYRYPAPGPAVVIGGLRLRCSRHEESHFIVIRTDATSFESGGTVDLGDSTALVDAFQPE